MQNPQWNSWQGGQSMADQAAAYANYQQTFGTVPQMDPSQFSAVQMQQWQQWQQQYQQWQQQYGQKYEESMRQMAGIMPIPAPNALPPLPSKPQAPPPLPPDEDKPPLPIASGQNEEIITPTPVEAPEEELSEAEKTFDVQFKQWEEQFESWKKQNAEHPDKTQYREYEKKWENWREQLLQRREQMRKKRLAAKAPTIPLLNKNLTQEASKVPQGETPLPLNPFNNEPLQFKKAMSHMEETSMDVSAKTVSTSNVSSSDVRTFSAVNQPSKVDTKMSTSLPFLDDVSGNVTKSVDIAQSAQRPRTVDDGQKDSGDEFPPVFATNVKQNTAINKEVPGKTVKNNLNLSTTGQGNLPFNQSPGPNNNALGGTPGPDRFKGGEFGGNMGRNFGPNQGENLLPNQNGNFPFNHVGNFGPNQGGNFGPNQVGNFGPNQGGNIGPNQGGNFGPNQCGNFGPNQGGNFGPNLGGNFGPNQIENFGPNHGGNFPPNLGGNFPPNLGGNFPPNHGPFPPGNFPPHAVGNFGSTQGGNFPPNELTNRRFGSNFHPMDHGPFSNENIERGMGGNNDSGNFNEGRNQRENFRFNSEDAFSDGGMNQRGDMRNNDYGPNQGIFSRSNRRDNFMTDPHNNIGLNQVRNVPNQGNDMCPSRSGGFDQPNRDLGRFGPDDFDRLPDNNRHVDFGPNSNNFGNNEGPGRFNNDSRRFANMNDNRGNPTHERREFEPNDRERCGNLSDIDERNNFIARRDRQEQNWDRSYDDRGDLPFSAPFTGNNMQSNAKIPGLMDLAVDPFSEDDVGRDSYDGPYSPDIPPEKKKLWAKYEKDDYYDDPFEEKDDDRENENIHFNEKNLLGSMRRTPERNLSAAPFESRDSFQTSDRKYFREDRSNRGEPDIERTQLSGFVGDILAKLGVCNEQDNIRMDSYAGFQEALPNMRRDSNLEEKEWAPEVFDYSEKSMKEITFEVVDYQHGGLTQRSFDYGHGQEGSSRTIDYGHGSHQSQNVIDYGHQPKQPNLEREPNRPLRGKSSERSFSRETNSESHERDRINYSPKREVNPIRDTESQGTDWRRERFSPERHRKSDRGLTSSPNRPSNISLDPKTHEKSPDRSLNRRKSPEFQDRDRARGMARSPDRRKSPEFQDRDRARGMTRSPDRRHQTQRRSPDHKASEYRRDRFSDSSFRREEGRIVRQSSSSPTRDRTDRLVDHGRSSERDRNFRRDRRDVRDKDRSPVRSRRSRSRSPRRSNRRSDKRDDGKGEAKVEKKSVASQDVTSVLVEDLLCLPGRTSRPNKIVFIMRGLSGSGKSYVTRLIKNKEVEMGGAVPRILSIDDYFMTDFEEEVQDEETGQRVKRKVLKYEYDADMEPAYQSALLKAFKKTVLDGFFNLIVVDSVNNLIKDVDEMWSYSKQKGFQVYVVEMDHDITLCTKRNQHGRSESDISVQSKNWEPTPRHYLRLDVRSLLQAEAIEEVEMEVVENVASEPTATEVAVDKQEDEDDTTANTFLKSKWDDYETSVQKLDRLDGLKKKKSTTTMEDFLSSEDIEGPEQPVQPGKKRVRWADLEEKRRQEKMRAIGFVVGQTDWRRMTDPTFGDSALTKTKYF